MKYGTHALDTEAIRAAKAKDWEDLEWIMGELSMHDLHELSVAADELAGRTWRTFVRRREMGEVSPI